MSAEPPEASTSAAAAAAAAQQQYGEQRAPRRAAATAATSKNSQEAASQPAPSGSTGIKPARLKLKIADSAVEESHYAQRQFDRDVDSDRDEPLHMEEQFILRLPENHTMTRKVSELVHSRELGTRKGAAKFEGEPWFKFRDARRAIFGFGKPDDVKRSETYQARLVDLPSIVESHKTLDQGKHMFKSADIVQMLIVDEQQPVKPGQDPGEKDKEKPFNIEDYVFDSGLTPPLQHARKRRFRRRANRRTIEAVERMVETLLAKDNMCEKVDYELIDPAEEEANALANATDGSLGAQTPGRSDMEGNASHESSQDEFDEHLAAELEKGLGEDDSDSSKDEEQDDDEGGSDSDMGGLFGGANASEEENILPGQEDEDEEESPAKTEARRRARLLADEIRDLETTIKKKNVDLAKQTNPILKNRDQDKLQKLMRELDLKRGLLNTAVNAPTAQEEQEERDAEDMEDAGARADMEEEDADDELFGGADDDDAEMADASRRTQ